mmetsp:Transcript_41599/g.39991  ORF Transcript_41599/g.39991 Transcript_41599/m.39991 type:complete len:94 (-) Transcript_41599:343-624(-)
MSKEGEPEKKTLIFCGIEELFVFLSTAQIISNSFANEVKLTKDGLKRKYKVFYRPHLGSFLQTLSQYFELILYLKEERELAKQLSEVLQSFFI